MNEFVSKSPDQSAPSSIGAPLRRTADQALAATRDVQNAAVDFANSSAEALKGHASELIGAAQDVAAHAGDRFQGKITDGEEGRWVARHVRRSDGYTLNL
jgi:hypothetical protein